LSRLRSWLVERSFAFLKCSATWPHDTSRYGQFCQTLPMHAAGYNLGLVMRHLYRHGTPERWPAWLFVCFGL
jgi:hypothetical protein